MKTFVINLERSVNRRAYMEQLLRSYNSLDVEFVRAVDGKLLNDCDVSTNFDIEEFSKRHMRKVNRNEIACSMSHRACYTKLLVSKDKYALILEDDIDTPSECFESIMSIIGKKIHDNIPEIILLSDCFWYTTKKTLCCSHQIADLYDGFLAHAYIINRAAAELILSNTPDYVADDWGSIKKIGVKIRGLIPHVIHQKWDGSFKTNIQSPIRESVGSPIFRFLRFLPHSICLKTLKIFGFYCPPYMNKEEW